MTAAHDSAANRGCSNLLPIVLRVAVVCSQGAVSRLHHQRASDAGYQMLHLAKVPYVHDPEEQHLLWLCGAEYRPPLQQCRCPFQV